MAQTKCKNQKNNSPIAQYRALYADTSVEILTLVSRDLVQRPERYPAAVPAAE